MFDKTRSWRNRKCDKWSNWRCQKRSNVTKRRVWSLINASPTRLSSWWQSVGMPDISPIPAEQGSSYRPSFLSSFPSGTWFPTWSLRTVQLASQPRSLRHRKLIFQLKAFNILQDIWQFSSIYISWQENASAVPTTSVFIYKKCICWPNFFYREMRRKHRKAWLCNFRAERHRRARAFPRR